MEKKHAKTITVVEMEIGSDKGEELVKEIVLQSGENIIPISKPNAETMYKQLGKILSRVKIIKPN